MTKVFNYLLLVMYIKSGHHMFSAQLHTAVTNLLQDKTSNPFVFAVCPNNKHISYW